MGEETPIPQQPNSSEQETDKPQLNQMIFRWNSMVAPPWDPGTYYFFLMPDNVFYEAALIGYPLDFAKNFHTAMAHFCSASSYAGLHKTIDRISADLILQGQDSGEATLLASIAAQLVQHGVAHFLPDFTHVLIHAVADEEKSNAFVYPTSPMHIWAFVQACEYMQKDLLPLFELKDGSDSYPFGEIVEIKQALDVTHQLLSTEIKGLMDGINPYKQISDLRAIGEMVSKQEQQPEQI